MKKGKKKIEPQRAQRKLSVLINDFFEYSVVNFDDIWD